MCGCWHCDPDVMPYFADYYWIPKDQTSNLAQHICQLLEPKSDEGRLLDSDTQCDLADDVNEIHPNLTVKLQATILTLIEEVAKAQDARTTSIKDKKCQERVERIFKDIEESFLMYYYPIIKGTRKTDEYTIMAKDERWQALKKQEGVE